MSTNKQVDTCTLSKLKYPRLVVSVWRRHLDRAADSGLRLPAVWQQFSDAAVHVSRQSRQHVFEISPWVMLVQLC